jgi:hypothetical protein
MNAKVSSDPSPAKSWDDPLAEAIQWPLAQWQEPDYRPLAYAKAGLLLGAIAGCVSLLVNVIGSVLWPAISGEPQHPLRLIQVLLTFPLGEDALQLESGYTLSLGGMIYLATGMLYGALLVLGISYVIPRASLKARFVFCSVTSLVLWLGNFYLLLNWLQPLLLGGRWIVELLPWWVAALTHLAFGATIATLYPLAPLSNKQYGPRNLMQEGTTRERV